MTAWHRRLPALVREGEATAEPHEPAAQARGKRFWIFDFGFWIEEEKEEDSHRAHGVHRENSNRGRLIPVLCVPWRPSRFQTELDSTAMDAKDRKGKTIPIPSAKICVICGSIVRLPPIDRCWIFDFRIWIEEDEPQKLAPVTRGRERESTPIARSASSAWA